MATHTYDFAKPEDIEDFQRVIRDALGEMWSRRLAPDLYRVTADGTIGRVASHELADMVCAALRREVEGKNFYGAGSSKSARAA
jgi:hypothetical protein